MTAAERRNAAILLQHATINPFTFMGSRFKCFYCTQYYSDPNELLEHTANHSVPDFNASLEKYIPKGKRALLVDISDLNCRICVENYKNLNEIREHLKNNHLVKFFPNGGNGMTEFKIETKDGVYSCHICSKKFHKFSLLNSHMNFHFGKVVCENCGAGFLDHYALARHTETHRIKTFQCKQCPKVFYKRSQLKYHNNLHKGKKKASMKCPYCTLTFKEYYSKMLHLKNTHGDFKIFECHVCKSCFNTRRVLTEHVTKMHTEKYKCEVCSKRFSIKSKLERHARSHVGDRDFVCELCNKTYMHKVTLNKHMRTHDNEKVH